MPFRILILGADGLTGINLTERLIGEGHFVRGVDIETERLAAFEGPQLEVIKGTIQDKALIEKVTDGIDIIFHLCNVYPNNIINLDDYYNILPNVESAIHVLEAAKEKGVKHVIYISSSGHNAYGIWKSFVKRLCFAYYENHNVPTTVFYPGGGILGPGLKPPTAWAPDWLLKPVYLGKEIRLPGLKYEEYKNHGAFYTHVFDFVSCLVKAMGNKNTFGERFTAPGGIWISNHDLFQQTIDLMHSSSQIVHYPIKKGTIVDGQPWPLPEPKTGGELVEKAKRIIGCQSRYSGRIVKDTVEYFLKTYVPRYGVRAKE